MLERFLSTKFLLTAGSLLAVFVLGIEHIDIRQFELIVPGILGFYMAGNVGQSVADNKYGNNNGTGNSTSSNNCSSEQ